MAKSTKLVLVVLAALLLVTAATLMIVRPTRGGGGGTTASTRSPQTATSSGAAPAGPSVTVTATDARAPLPPVSEHQAAERAAMLAAIARARDARAHRTVAPPLPLGPRGAPTTTGSDSGGTTLDLTDMTGDNSDWEKHAIGTVNHLLGQCYDLALAENPDLAGTVAVELTLVGEPDVGGVLERVDIDEAHTTIKQQTVRDCLVQQLYALELEPPPVGVTVKREISLSFPR